EAADEPALRAAAERAQARGKLALARLDSAAPPVGFKAAANLANWLGNEQTRAWREVLSAVGAAAKPPAKGAAKSAPSKPAPSVAPAAEAKKGAGAGLGISLLVLLAAGGAAAAHFVLHLF
ncbi:MAG TPA: hypothetical protein VG943_14340, partial [Caulobacterales bacterium]|nr:hypothetical protein [Caulobacterales bacterium]